MLRQRKQLQQQRADEIEIFPSKATSPSDTWWWLYPASNALTENEEQIWNAGRFAPAFIRFEFAVPFNCTRIELLPCMVPASGSVTYKIHMGNAEVHNFTENSVDGKWMNVDLTQTGMRAKVIEVHTLDSPSWVAWRRVRFWANVK
jgi:hypothetical protein